MYSLSQKYIDELKEMQSPDNQRKYWGMILESIIIEGGSIPLVFWEQAMKIDAIKSWTRSKIQGYWNGKNEFYNKLKKCFELSPCIIAPPVSDVLINEPKDDNSKGVDLGDAISAYERAMGMFE